jgi:multiple sugar transport system permease protein
MFLIVLVLSLLVMRWSAAWSYYEGELKSRDGGDDA